MCVVKERINQSCEGVPHCCLEAYLVFMLVHPGSSFSMRSCSVSLVRAHAVSCVDVMLLSLSLQSELSLLSLGAVDAMTLRLSMRRLGSPKDGLTLSKMSSVADGVLVDESEASTLYELPWIVGVMRLSLLAVLLGGV